MSRTAMIVKDGVVKVLEELTEFAEQLLPAMAAKNPECFPDHVVESEPGWRQRLLPLEDWRGAAQQLRQHLATRSTSQVPELDAAEFHRFLQADASPSYVIRDGRIHWQISVFVPWDWAEAAKLSTLPPECRPRDASDTARSIGAAKRWMLGASAQDSNLHNCLCIVLPCIANHDSVFARMILDVDAWRGRIQSNPAICDAERAQELAAVDGRAFRNVLNNSLLHVIAALANNHFSEIGYLVDNEIFLGRYTRLVIHYVFAVLFAKVQVLTGQIPLDVDRFDVG
jgi:hypothetical protein